MQWLHCWVGCSGLLQGLEAAWLSVKSWPAKGGLFVTSVRGCVAAPALCSCFTEFLDLGVINCPSEHSATVEGILLRELEICLRQSRDPWDALSQEWVSGWGRSTWDAHTGWDLEPQALHKANKIRSGVVLEVVLVGELKAGAGQTECFSWDYCSLFLDLCWLGAKWLQPLEMCNNNSRKSLPGGVMLNRLY